jgi:hypothetical protein
MLSKYAGEERFLRGVSLYLKKRLFGNSVTTDLWEGISEATGIIQKIILPFFSHSQVNITGIDVAKIMDPWINKVEVVIF